MDSVTTTDGRLRIWQTFRDVKPDELFSYWTEPNKLKGWWPDEATIDPISGGQYRYGFPQVGHILTGTFSEVKPGQRLAFSWHWEHEPNAHTQQVVADFEPRDSDTLLTVTHGPYGADEAGKAFREGQLESWIHFIEKLKIAVHQR